MHLIYGFPDFAILLALHKTHYWEKLGKEGTWDFTVFLQLPVSSFQNKGLFKDKNKNKNKAPWKMANSNSKAVKEIQDKPGKCSKYDGDMPNGHRHQPEGVSTDKILDNWSKLLPLWIITQCIEQKLRHP